MKTLIALDDQEELIDKFEGAMDGINSDMALAEKALKVGFCIRNDYIFSILSDRYLKYIKAIFITRFD